MFDLETLRFFAWPIDVTNTKKSELSTTEQMSTLSSDTQISNEKGDWWCDLHRCGLLLQLIEALEKCMYNAYEGAASSLPQLPKVGFIFRFVCSIQISKFFFQVVKFFFIANKSVCLEWLNRIRIPLILTSVRSGQYESAVRNCNQYLMHVCALGQAEVVVQFNIKYSFSFFLSFS